MSARLTILFCLLQSGTLMAETLQAQQLKFEVTEAGQAPYLSRMLVTQQMMRIDQGSNSADFILLDRAKQVIYSINHEERSILVIKPKPIKQADTQRPDIRILVEDAVEAPQVAGRKAEHWTLLVDGQVCQEAMVLPGMLVMSVAAQGEYLSLLAEQHKLTLSSIPQGYRDACADAIQVYAPSGLLEKGLPLRLWDVNGNLQILTDFRESLQLEADLFNLPEAFTRRSMPQ
jgi:hypothetical protein